MLVAVGGWILLPRCWILLGFAAVPLCVCPAMAVRMCAAQPACFVPCHGNGAGGWGGGCGAVPLCGRVAVAAAAAALQPLPPSPPSPPLLPPPPRACRAATATATSLAAQHHRCRRLRRQAGRSSTWLRRRRSLTVRRRRTSSTHGGREDAEVMCADAFAESAREARARLASRLTRTTGAGVPGADGGSRCSARALPGCAQGAMDQPGSIPGQTSRDSGAEPSKSRSPRG